jgi:hypothetical protein
MWIEVVFTELIAALCIHKYRIWYCINQVLLVLLLYIMVIAYWIINPSYIKYIYDMYIYIM